MRSVIARIKRNRVATTFKGQRCYRRGKERRTMSEGHRGSRRVESVREDHHMDTARKSEQLVAMSDEMSEHIQA